MNFSKEGKRYSVEAAIAVVAAGWVANTSGLNLAAAGVLADNRGFVKVDEHMRTSASHIFAAGDVTGHLMLVPPAIQEGFVAATNAVLGPAIGLKDGVNTSAGFTEPEYASAGMTEAKARETHDIVTAIIHFELHHPHNYRWAQGWFLQAHCRSQDREDIRLPRCWRKGSGDSASRGNCYFGGDAGG